MQQSQQASATPELYFSTDDPVHIMSAVDSTQNIYYSTPQKHSQKQSYQDSAEVVVN
jgi:hypothetical protein